MTESDTEKIARLERENQILKEKLQKEHNMLQRERTPVTTKPIIQEKTKRDEFPNVEKRNGENFIVIRNSSGKVVKNGVKKFDANKYDDDIAYFKQHRTFHRATRETSYGKVHEYKNKTKIRFYKVDESGKFSGISEKQMSVKRYQYFIEGEVVAKNGHTMPLTCSSNTHESTFPKAKARQEVLDSFYANASYMRNPDSKSTHYDTSEGKFLESKGQIKILNEYIAIRTYHVNK